MEKNNLLGVVKKELDKYSLDENLSGRIFVDLSDIFEACKWFVDTIESEKFESLSQDELETLLINIDVNLIQHISYHLESLRKDFPVVLDAIGLPEDKDK
ncbi:hypothetical protein [Variovorax sp. PAMC26660]|uniref:hypothetical protein n=1 Tax=Variovorax sp. PAMC26660 TaxID=2762322 RepID=UPI00164CE3E1|nr:hypothetical protein [Variovorax sp. PAMC26660]QNK69471.1 hypothetical protein H7F35_07185 [Variovorax sp. PAMC26660]